MGSRVGHGSGNTVGHVGTLKSRQLEAPRVKLTAKQRAKEGVRGGNAGEARGENLRVTLGELVVGKKS